MRKSEKVDGFEFSLVCMFVLLSCRFVGCIEGSKLWVGFMKVLIGRC